MEKLYGGMISIAICLKLFFPNEPSFKFKRVRRFSLILQAVLVSTLMTSFSQDVVTLQFKIVKLDQRQFSYS